MPTNPRTNRTRKSDWRPRFLAALDTIGTVTEACKAAGIGRTTVYDERQRNEDFALAWADVDEQVTERMEQEAYRRAVDGVHRDVFYKGDVVGEEQHYSDTLLIFMLKARRPEKYRDNVTVHHAGNVTVNTGLVTDPTLAGEARALLRRAASPSAN